MRSRKALLSLVVFTIIVVVSFSVAYAQARRTPGHGANFFYVVEPELQPIGNRCPADTPYLLVTVLADHKGTATDNSLCQNPGGAPILCGSATQGYGDRSLGPGLTSVCISEVDLP
jgi:hypothetical protein